MGNDFITYSPTGFTGFAPFSAYNAGNDLGQGAVPADTLKLTSTPSYTAGGTSAMTARTYNAINFAANGLNAGNQAGVLPMTTATLTAGGLMVGGNGNTDTVSFPVLALAAVEGIVHVPSASSGLTISSTITGTAGLTKDGAGSLTLSGTLNYTGATTLSGGNVALQSPIVPLATATIPTVSALNMNAGVLDLSGVNQVFGTLASANLTYQPGTGGTITNSSSSPVTITLASGGASTFAGQINETAGQISLIRQGGATGLTLLGPSTYTGPTTVMGGSFTNNATAGLGLTLRDSATLASTTYYVNFGALVLDNTGLGGNIGNRIPSGSTVNLRQGELQLFGAPGVASSQTVSTVNLFSGSSYLVPVTNTAPDGAGFTINNLTGVTSGGNQVPGVTVNFGAQAATLGSPATGQVILNAVDGSALTDGQFLPWATVGMNDLAVYKAGLGVVAYGSNGTPAYDTTYGSGKVFSNATAAITLPASGGPSSLGAGRAVVKAFRKSWKTTPMPSCSATPTTCSR